MAKKKVLWVKNNTGADVSLSDLGVKVLANKTINVYAYNPYITTEQVNNSRLSGSLSKRLESETLVVVKGTKNPNPHTLNHIKTSPSAISVIKSKTSVFINTSEEDVLEDDDLGDIADYGLGDLGHNNTINVRTEDGSIVVEQVKDDPESEIPGLGVGVKSSSGASGQSITAMTRQAESQSDPVGPIADSSSPPNKPFVIVNPSEDPVEIKEETKSATKIKKIGDTIVIDENSADSKEALVDDSVESYDTQVATKDESGSIVMKIKETAKKVTKAKKKRKKKTK